MNIWTKPIYLNIRIRTILIFFVILVLLIVGVALYKNYVFHNLFFATLSVENIESISVYDDYRLDATQLSQEEIQELVSLLRNIRLQGAPYADFGLLGDYGNDYRIKLKNGICFDLDVSGGDPGVYILNEKAYSIGYRNDSAAKEAFENIWRLEELHSKHQEKYYPKN